MKTLLPLLALGLVTAFLPGCNSQPEQRNEAVHRPSGSADSKVLKQEFERISASYHNASAEAHGAVKENLLREAEQGYRDFLKNHGDDAFWGSQAMINLAGVRALRGDLPEAVKLYGGVEKRYPRQQWEILQAWKSAADLLWEDNRKDEARTFYQKIVQNYSREESTAVVALIVRASRTRLASTAF